MALPGSYVEPGSVRLFYLKLSGTNLNLKLKVLLLAIPSHDKAGNAYFDGVLNLSHIQVHWSIQNGLWSAMYKVSSELLSSVVVSKWE